MSELYDTATADVQPWAGVFLDYQGVAIFPGDLIRDVSRHI